MLKNIIEKNESVTVNEKQIDIIKRYFPSCFNNEGSLDIKKLEQVLNENGVDITKEGYELNFLGKSYAKLLTALESETIIKPDLDHNGKEENKNSQNIYISGDNLDAIKHLLKSYSGQIKCIYIDPPYNTGTDGFVYMDNFKFTPDQLSEKIGISHEEAQRILNMTSRGSASHSAWLTFMYPRLYIARDLLSDDGVIFISIDDNEQVNLKMICDEIFGEENFLSQVIVQSNKRGQTYKQLAKTHEYALVYTKNADVIVNELQKEVGDFQYIDNIGEYSIRELRNRNPKYGKFNRPNLFYPIYVNTNLPDKDGFYPVSLKREGDYSVEVYPFNSEGRESCWRWGTPKCKDNIKDNNTLESNLVGKLKNTGEYGIYEKYRKTTYKAKTIWMNEILGDEAINSEGDIWEEKDVITEQGSIELGELGLSEMFDFPKPTYLINKIMMIGSNKDSVVLDFFSGSGTTAHAIMQLNAEDDGSRKYIMVQLPENLDEKLIRASSSDKPKVQKVIDFLDSNNRPHILSEIGIERIKRAADKIKNETQKDIDYGFKIYNLVSPQEKTLDKMLSFDPNKLAEDTSILTEYGTEAVLTTWKVQDGYGFNAKLEEINLSGYTAFKCDNTLYFIEPNITTQDIKILIEKYQNESGFFPNRIVLFGYSFNFTQLSQLKDNLKQVTDYRKIDVITRY